MKIPIFWDITLRISLDVNRRFGEACLLHLQGQRVSQAINQHEAGCNRIYAWRIFYPEDGGDIFSEPLIAFQRTT
jgi:hypothetical protein